MALIPDTHTLFVIDLHYVVPLDQIEPHIDDHMAFLEAQYAAGHFLASGRKEPRTGGVILATSDDRATIEDLVTLDPFHQHGLAEYRITEFHPSMTAPGLK